MVAGIGFRAVITGEQPGIVPARPTFIERCGSFIADLFHQPTTFTISTGTGDITNSPIWLVSAEPNTSAPIRLNSSLQVSLNPHPLVRCDLLLNPSETLLAMFNEVKPPARGGTLGRGIRASVRTAVSRFCRHILRGRSGAISIAKWKRFDVSAERPWVYDLTVEGHACYQANGILVSNSDAFRYLATRQKTPVEKPKTVMAPRYNSGGTGWMG
jgi:hypothetical protein